MAEDTIGLAPVASFEQATRERQDKPFFDLLPRPFYPDCDHSRRGVTLDPTTRQVFCKCGKQIDAFDALLLYAHAEKRLVSTREDIEQHKKEEADKKREQAERKPFLRETNGYSAVFNPRPPKGDGAMIGYDVRLSCGHTVRWPSKGRRSPTRHMTCDICLRSARKDLAVAATR